MSKTQIQNQIADLNFWLRHNPNHHDYATQERKRELLKRELIKTKTRL